MISKIYKVFHVIVILLMIFYFGWYGVWYLIEGQLFEGMTLIGIGIILRTIAFKSVNL